MLEVDIEIKFPHVTMIEHPNYSDMMFFEKYNTFKSFYQLKKDISFKLHQLGKPATYSELKLCPYQGSNHPILYVEADEVIDDISIIEYLNSLDRDEDDFLKVNCELKNNSYITLKCFDSEFPDSPHVMIRMDQNCHFQQIVELSVRKITGYRPQKIKINGTEIVPEKTPQDYRIQNDTELYFYK